MNDGVRAVTPGWLAGLAGACAAGAAAGGLYFGGLWWTVNRTSRAGRPNLLLAASFLLRVIPLLVFFVVIVRWSWTAGPAAMAGFLLARRFWTRRVREPSAPAAAPAKSAPGVRGSEKPWI